MNRSEQDVKALFAYMWRVAIVVALIFAIPVTIFQQEYPWLIIVPVFLGTAIVLRGAFKGKPPRQFADSPQIVSEED